jgi:hypothetical protein
MRLKAAMIGLACLFAGSVAGCGSSAAPKTPTTSAQPPLPHAALMNCLQKDGYASTPETPGDVHTAPASFEFTAVWNVLNPSRVALALTFSRNTAGAERAAVWTRRKNITLAKGALHAPVVRIGKIDVLWTSTPGARNMHDVYGCIRQSE